MAKKATGPPRKKAGHNSQVHPMAMNGVAARLNYQSYSDQSCRISGYIVDARTCVRRDEELYATRTAKTPGEIPEAERLVIGKLTELYAKASRPKVTVVTGDRPFSEAYESLSPEAREGLFLSQWRAKNTRDKRRSYFVSVLKLLDEYGLDLDANDAAEVLGRLKEAAEQSGNHRHNPLVTERWILKQAVAFNAMYMRFRAACLEYGLPEFELPVLASVKSVEFEQCKSLPEGVPIKLGVLLRRLIHNGLACGGILMLGSLVRTAEACAPTFGDIVFYKDFAVYAVLWQTDGKGVRVADLKSRAAYRVIVISKFGTEMLQLRMDHLRKQGYAEAEILSFPVVSSPLDPRVMAKPKELSAFIRQLLELLGHGEMYWKAIETLMAVEPDVGGDGRTPEYDPSAYALRRSGCTLLTNAAAIDPDFVDAFMGHKLRPRCTTQWDKWLRRPESWPVVAAWLERIVWDPRCSMRFTPIEVCLGDCCSFPDGQARFCFQAASDEEALELEITIQTREAGAEVVIEAPDRGARITAKPMSLEKAEGAVIAPVYDEEYYMKWIREAEEINLSEIDPRTEEKEVSANEEKSDSSV